MWDAASKYLWTITILTIPGRERYCKQLIESINNTPLHASVQIAVIYNFKTAEDIFAIERQIKDYSANIPLSVYFNSQDTSIVSGRNFQLNVCKSPLICFIDDDVTLHGEVFPELENVLRDKAMGVLGIRSYKEDTDELFKPHPNTPQVEYGGIRYATVQGMLAAGYRKLFLDIGGFNPRRGYWGEWTELNLRMWRSGFPTGYCMDCGHLRHWHDAPQSPTRNMDGKEIHVLWGLLCTALEYDAVEINEATETFWRLIEERYLVYSFGEQLSAKRLLKTTLELMPRISSEWGQINAFKAQVAQHPFQFKPFHRFTVDDIKKVLKYCQKHIGSYHTAVWKPLENYPYTGVVNGRLRRLAKGLKGLFSSHS
jgi:glycosyltransferase involved in cell wall biosynthesis